MEKFFLINFRSSFVKLRITFLNYCASRLTFHISLLLFFFSSLFFSENNIAQETDSTKIYQLTDVVVSATKNETNSLHLANSVTVIDSNEIANSNAFTVYDLLKDKPGISFTQQGGPGTFSSIYLRGANPGHALVLIDGVEVNLTNDPGNVYDFANLPVDNIQQIEILRGPQSTLYGSDALAGIINMITKKSNSTPNIIFSAEGGSYNTYKGVLSSNGSFDKFDYSVSLSRIDSDGFSAAGEKYGNTEKDGFRSDAYSLSLNYNYDKNISTKIISRFNNSIADYDQAGGVFGDDPTYIFDQEEFLFRNISRFSFFDGVWKPEIGISYFRNIRKYEYDSTFNNPVSSNSRYDGNKIKLDWQNELNVIKNNRITFGLEYETEKAVSEFYSYSSFGPFVSLFPENDTRTLGFYLQDEFQFENSLFVSGGIRLDDHKNFGTAFTYRFAPAYIFWQTGTKIKATIGTGFKAPSLFYLYDPAFGNPDLDPERSFGWDVGIEQFLWGKGFSIGITYFNISFDDLFGFDENFRTINTGEAETKGVELYSTFRVFQYLLVKGNYTYTDAIDKNNNNLPLIRRPEHKAALFTTYNFGENGNIGYEMIYVGKRDDFDFSTFPAERKMLESYILVNLMGSYNILEFLKLTLRIENVFDEDYEEILGYGTAGRSFYGGIKLTLN